jgi:hypothetical protein
MSFSYLTESEQESLHPASADILAFLRSKRDIAGGAAWYRQHELVRVLYLSRHQVRRALLLLLRKQLVEQWNANLSPSMYRATEGKL